MQFDTFTTAVPAALGLASQAHGINYEIFSDDNCQDKYTELIINPATCAIPSPGCPSMRLLGPGETGVTLTVYSVNNCGTPTAGSKGFSADDPSCLKDFKFVANAAGFW